MPTYPNESETYRQARADLIQAEAELRAKTEEVAALRRQLPLGGVAQDYVFEGEAGPVTLSSLFGEHDTLILYSYMYGPEDSQPCPMCSAFLDGADGLAPHIRQRAAFAVVARCDLATLQTLAESRGWRNHRLLSAAGNSYATDYHSEMPNGAQVPMANVFVRRDGQVHHFWGSRAVF